MKKEPIRIFYMSIFLLVAFILWTALITFVDVAPIGPMESSVGFHHINQFVHKLFGVHMSIYNITDWLGYVTIGIAVGFLVFGIVQWIKRKNILKVDYSIRILGLFYLVVIGVYVLFELVVINYRPILIESVLEASYPSSTTMLALCVIPTAIMQFRSRIKNNVFKNLTTYILAAFTAFMVVGRLISGVHWFTDIFGGILFSTGLVLMYKYVVGLRAE